MKKILIFIILSLIYINGFTQVNQMDVRKLNVRNWIIYQGDTLGVANYHDDTLFVEQGNTIDTIPLLAIAISGDTIFAGGDTLVASGVSHWTKTGDDIENNNAGKVILPGDSTFFDAIPGEATKVGRILHVNQYGEIEWTSPAKLGDTIAVSGGGPWTQGTGAVYPTKITDRVGIGTTAPTNTLDVKGAARFATNKRERCAVVFTDDDGWREVYTELFPIFEAKGVPGCVAINADRHIPDTIDAKYLHVNEMREMQAAGWEVLSHGINHERLIDLLAEDGEDTTRWALYHCRDLLNDSGLICNNHCYAFSAENYEVRRLVKDYFRGGLGHADQSVEQINADNYEKYPLRTYNMNRFEFDGIYWSGGYDPESIQYRVDSSKTYFHFKSIIDTAIKYNYVIHFMCHSRFLANDSLAFLDKDSNYVDHWTITEQILDYLIDSVSVPVWTFNQLLDSCENIIDIGDQEDSNGWFAVSAGGSLPHQKLTYKNTAFGRWAGAYTDTNYTQTYFGWKAGYNAEIYGEPTATNKHHTAIGYEAGVDNTKGCQTAIGYRAGMSNTGIHNTAIGHNAAYSNSGGYLTAAGGLAGYDNSGTGVSLLGYSSGYGNTGNYLTALGSEAGSENTAADVVAIGRLAGKSAAVTMTAVGTYAGSSNTGTNSLTAFGYWAGRNNSGDRLTAYGSGAGYNNTGDRLTAFGSGAGTSNTGDECIIIGYWTGGSANTTNNRFILGNRIANATPLLSGDLANNRLSIGSATAPDSALTVTGGGRFTGGLKAAESLTVTGLDSASTSYGLYYDKATGIITYDSAGSGGTADSYWDEANDTVTTDYNVRVDSSFIMNYDSVYIGYHIYPAAPETGLMDGFRAGINFADSSAFFASGYGPGDNLYTNYMYSGYESFNELGSLSAFVSTNYDADDNKTSVLITSGDGGSNTSEIIVTPDSVRIDSGKIILAGDLIASEDDPVWISDSATYISKSQARSDINDSLVANSQGFITSTLAADLNAASYNIDNVDTLTVDNLIMTSPSAWMDQFRQRPMFYTELWGSSTTYTTPWSAAAINSGTWSGIAGLTNHPGIVKFTSSTTSNSGYYIANGTANLVGLTGGEMIEFGIYFVQFDSTTTHMGFIDGTSAESTDGAYFQIATDGTAKGKTSNNSSRSETGTYGLSLATWYRFKVLVTSTSRVDYYIYNDAGTELWTGNVTTNIPTARATASGIASTKTTSGTGGAKDLIWIDYISMYLGALTR